MKKSLGLLVLSLGLMAAPLVAGETKADQSAKVEAVVGKVSADSGKGFKRLRAGQELAVGSTVKTGKNSRVALRLADGSSARIAANTEFTLRDEPKKVGIFTRLVRGTVRFLVAKQAQGHAFETEMANGVAAVKGTDPEYETDGKSDHIRVFSSENPVALLFRDKDSDKEKSLRPGEKLTFENGEFKIEKLDVGEDDISDDQYKGLPEPKLDEKDAGDEKKDDKRGEKKDDEKDKRRDKEKQKEEEKRKEEEKKKEEEKRKEGDSKTEESRTLPTRGEVLVKLDEITDKAIEEAKGELYLDGFLERDERNGDIAAGRIVYDRFGERVQVSHYIDRTEKNAVEISSYSLRDGGPNKGTSFVSETTTFNKTLPEDWGVVYSMPYDSEKNLDKNGYPIFFRVSQSLKAGNPFGDSLGVSTKFDHPRWAHDGVKYGAMTQLYGQSITLNGQLMQTYEPSVTDGSPGSMTYDSTVGVSYLIDSRTNAVWNNTVAYFEGGYRFSYTNDDPNNPSGLKPFLVEDIHVLGEKGEVLKPLLPKNFAAVPGNLWDQFDANIEVSFNSPKFKSSIDIIFLPGFYSQYTLIDHPLASYSTTP